MVKLALSLVTAAVMFTAGALTPSPTHANQDEQRGGYDTLSSGRITTGVNPVYHRHHRKNFRRPAVKQDTHPAAKTDNRSDRTGANDTFQLAQVSIGAGGAHVYVPDPFERRRHPEWRYCDEGQVVVDGDCVDRHLGDAPVVVVPGDRGERRGNGHARGRK